MADYNITRADMDYKVQVLSENATLVSVYPMVSAGVSEGDAVQMTTSGWDNTITTESGVGGLVVSGKEDSSIGDPANGQMKGSGKPIVVVGNAVVRVAASCITNFGGLAVNDLVSYKSGKVQKKDTAGNAAGYVLEVNADKNFAVIVLY